MKPGTKFLQVQIKMPVILLLLDLERDCVGMAREATGSVQFVMHSSSLSTSSQGLSAEDGEKQAPT